MIFPSLRPWQKLALGLGLYDFIALCLAYFLALWVRFDCRLSHIPEEYLAPYLQFIPWYAGLSILIFWKFRLYNSMWQFASYRELMRCCLATLLTVPLHVILIYLVFTRMPISYYVLGAGFQFGATLFSRFVYRLLILERAKYRRIRENNISSARGMLIGAGAAGQLVLRDFMTSDRANVQICCVIDDDINKWNRSIEGIPIVGGRDDILSNVKKYNIEKIFLAIPTASAQVRRDILNICNETGCELKTLPGLYQLANNEVTISKMKPVAVEDLLGREEISVDMDEICSNLAGRVIMVTGGGGSIGSELCRQIAEHKPKLLIIFDLYENNAYDIQQELKMSHPEINLLTLIGSVRDSRRLNQVFAAWRPELVFHAAAHKHVPLMEDSPCEAIKNNVLGTYKTAFAALAHGCRRFVLISTDKAVNPTNIMGASKRLCEMIIQTMDKVARSGNLQCLPHLHSYGDENGVPLPLSANPETIATEFVAVRFGNVLGSNGSVIPLFKKQIEKGGPVTVTHPDIIRYFMTIPEAVSLVLQASVYANGGEIFVLDMGAAMKIDTLARNLIKLSGYKPDIDIKIEYTGLRPGEKLYEEILMDAEGLRKTPNKLIHIGTPLEINTAIFLKQLKELAEVAYANGPTIANLVEGMVPTCRFSAGKQENVLSSTAPLPKAQKCPPRVRDRSLLKAHKKNFHTQRQA